MRVKPYLQLIRLPNVLTAAADSLGGWLLVGGSLGDPGGWGPLAAASMAIYAAGIALNDVFDLDIDRAERPGRPLPSGRVPVRVAIGLGGGLLAVGLVAATLGGESWRTPATAGALVAAVLAYDAGLKRTPLGPEVMGLCRGLNVLLGMSVAERFGGPMAWLVAGSMAAFIVGVTWISRSETEVGRRAGPIAGLVLQGAAFVALVAACLRPSAFPDRPSGPGVGVLVGLAILGLVAFRVLRATGRGVADPRPSTLQPAVKAGVLSLIWVHTALVVAIRGPLEALCVASLWLPASLAARWIYST